MKIIRYKIPGKTVVYNPETDAVEEREIFSEFIMQWSEAAEEQAKREALNGEYTIEDDGEPEAPQTDAKRIAELEEALELLLSGVTE